MKFQARTLEPTLTLPPELKAKYAGHVAACDRLDCPPVPASEFFADWLNAPAQAQQEILNEPPRQPAPPAFYFYEQYVSPKHGF